MKKYVFIIILMLLLTGCAAEEPGTSLDLSTAQTVPMSDAEQIPLISHSRQGSRVSNSATQTLPAEDGMFVLQQSELEGGYYLLHYQDHVTHEIYPTCVLTNCTHNTPDCPAILKSRGLIHYDGTWIYYISSKDGTDTILRQKADGSERETVLDSSKDMGKDRIGRIDTAVWQDGDIYFEMSGTLFDRNTGEITTGEQICRLDVTTGDMLAYPELMDTNQDNGLYMEGIYGDNLILRYNEMVSKTMGNEKYRDTYFLYHVETGEIKILISGDPGPGGLYGAYQLGIEDGILIFQSQKEQDSLALSVDGCASRTALLCRCERFLFDLEQECGYIIAPNAYVCNRDEIGDGYLIHFMPNAEKTLAIPLFRNLQTGEEKPMPTVFPEYDWYRFSVHGDFYLFRLWKEGDMIGTVYIRSEDFWAGKPDYHFFPEWA